MTDLQAWVAPTFLRLAHLLDDESLWDRPSLCERWLVRHVVAHVTMPARLTPAQFGAEMAAAAGDFTVLSDTVAERDGSLPHDELRDALRSPALHTWQPPGGGETGALVHAVVHSLDITAAVGAPPVAPPDALVHVRGLLADGTVFGVVPDALDAATGTDDAEAVALLAGRTLTDGRGLPRA